ncbi:MAG: Spy/CpxP family protein refolding chaperone [Candidatus Neomarinimicrobiota bacterium]
MKTHLKCVQFLISLLVVLMALPGQLAAQGWSDRQGGQYADPGAPSFGPQLQRPDKARPGTAGLQRQRRGWTDPQRRLDRLNTVKMWKLTEYLGLSEEQAEKFFPRTQEHQKEADEIVRKRRQLYEEFQQKMDAGKISAKDVDQYVAEVAKLDKSHIDLRAKHIESLKDILTDEQRAKFAVFNEHFRRQLQYQLREEILPPVPPPEEEED